MATVAWKRVFTSADTIPLANGGTNSTSTQKGFVVNDGDSINSIAGTSGQLLIGQGQAAASAHDVDGVITINASGTTSFIGQPVVTSVIDDNAVTMAKLQDLGAGGIIRGLDTGEPGILPIGDQGQVLKVNTSVNGKLEFGDAPSATNVVIKAGGTGETDAQTDALPVIFGNDTGNSQQLFGDVTGGTTHFTYDANASFAHKTGTGASDGGSAGVSSSSGFIGDLAGIASGSNLQKISVSAAGGASSLLLAPNGTTNGQFRTPIADNKLQWNGSKLTITGDLDVIGDVTQTSIEVVNSEFDDVLIKVAGGSANDGAATSAGPNGVGIAVDNGTANDANLARFVYKGHDDSSSVLGWRIAQATDNTATSAATAYGVGVMAIRAFAATESSLADTGQQGAVDIGIGAMLFSTDDTSGGLFIQVGG
mgnify:CR=1 FL=1|tara:strand:+ start:1194 stop:2462 length:1269 start_codon:yes stop_codon:yes gene_type:complete